MNEEELKTIFLRDDIFPLGEFETLPVKSIRDGKPNSYPEVVYLRDVENVDLLRQEAEAHIEHVGHTYVKDRVEHLNPDIDEESLRNVLGDVGFVKGLYQSFSLRKKGTAELEDWVGPETRRLFQSLPVSTFRQQYAVAYPGWNIKLHRDHQDFLTHGFRAMVPINYSVYMGYELNGQNRVYELKPGGMYFVNISRMHRGFNHSDTERVNLIMQMDSDEMVLNGTAMAPLPDAEVEQLGAFATQYETWGFGNEL